MKRGPCGRVEAEKAQSATQGIEMASKRRLSTKIKVAR